MFYTLYDYNGNCTGQVEVKQGEPNEDLAFHIVPGSYSPFSKFIGGEVVDLDDEAQELKYDVERLSILRESRTKELAASDWTQVSDVPLSEEQRESWRTYRQALRDLPATVDIRNPVWPNKPEDN